MKSCTSCRYFGIWSKECYKSEPNVNEYNATKTYMKAETFRVVCNGVLYVENNVPKLKFW